MIEKVEPAGSTFFFLFVVFVIGAPLYKASNRPLPLLLLELAAIGFLFVLARRGVARAALEALPRSLTVALVILFAYPLVQLVPLPEFLWRVLPGHAEYATVLERFADAQAGRGPPRDLGGSLGHGNRVARAACRRSPASWQSSGSRPGTSCACCWR